MNLKELSGIYAEWNELWGDIFIQILGGKENHHSNKKNGINWVENEESRKKHEI